jgi:hypothetical protein
MPPLNAFSDGLHTAEDSLRLPGNVRLPIRMTVVELPDGGVLVHSPTPPDPALVDAVTAIGPVRHLVAPNLLHHVSVGAWHERFPSATLWAPAGLARKRPDLRVQATLGPAEPGSAAPAAPPWAATFEPLPLAGCPSLDETVFFHGASRSLVCTDLLFNIRVPATWTTGLVLTLMGTRGKLAMSRAWRRYGRDRAALAESLERVLTRDFRRVLPGHGDVFQDEGAVAACRAALAWGLRQRPRQ